MHHLWSQSANQFLLEPQITEQHDCFCNSCLYLYKRAPTLFIYKLDAIIIINFWFYVLQMLFKLRVYYTSIYWVADFVFADNLKFLITIYTKTIKPKEDI